MAKAAKKKEPTKKVRKSKYDEKFAVVGSFKDIIKAAVKDAKSKSAPKKP
jgi:hypothetical protein